MRLLCLFTAGLLVTGCGQSAGYNSPEEVFQAEQTARRNYDFGKSYDCLTPESQEYRVGMILAGIGYQKQPEKLDKDAPSALAAWQAHLKEMPELARRHGVDVEALPNDVSVLDPDACRALAARFPVDDPRDFFVEYWQKFTSVQESMTGKQLMSKVFTLTDLEIDGDHASAIKRDEEDSMHLPVSFQRIDGTWFVDEVAVFKRGETSDPDE